MAAGKKIAAGTLILGLRGEVHAGDEIPATYLDLYGKEQPTDFERLRNLGLIEGEKPDAEPE